MKGMTAFCVVAACLCGHAFAAPAWMPGLAGPSLAVSGEYEACRALAAAGQFKEAEAIANELIAADRRQAGAWHALGTCRWMAGDRQGAQEAWRMSLELQDNPELRAFLAGADDATTSPPAPQPCVSPEIEFRAALVLFGAGRREEALARAAAAAKTRPDRWAAWVLVGDVRASVFDRDGAEEAWRKALSLRPGDRALADAIGLRRSRPTWCRSCPGADVLENELAGAKPAAAAQAPAKRPPTPTPAPPAASSAPPGGPKPAEAELPKPKTVTFQPSASRTRTGTGPAKPAAPVQAAAAAPAPPATSPAKPSAPPPPPPDFLAEPRPAAPAPPAPASPPKPAAAPTPAPPAAAPAPAPSPQPAPKPAEEPPPPPDF